MVFFFIYRQSFLIEKLPLQNEGQKEKEREGVDGAFTPVVITTSVMEVVRNQIRVRRVSPSGGTGNLNVPDTQNETGTD